MRSIHVVDGTFELFRAHFAPRPGKVTTVDGKRVDVKATVGVMGSLLHLLTDASEGATHVAVAFDNPIRSFRNDLFDSYKSDEGVPPELRAQFGIVEEATRALGIVVWSMDRWEADDAMATAVARYGSHVDQVRILSPDKDLGQCLEGDRVVQVDRIRRKVIDEPTMRAVRGVAPASIPDLLALTGDTADGVPGLPGWGAKSAAALLARWGTIEAIPDDERSWDVKVTGAPRLAATLRERREDALLYKKLTTLVRDVPLGESFEDLAFRGVPKDAFHQMCDFLGARDLRERPTRWRDA
jgi:5'-3' exonuclease